MYHSIFASLPALNQTLIELNDFYVPQYCNMVKQQWGQEAYNNLMQNLIFTQQMKLAEHHIYGSTRIGIKYADTTMYARNITINGFDTLGNVLVNEVLDAVQLQIDTAHYQHALATKQYELTNHLGNVLATVLDRKTNHQADVVSAQHYYPFGSTMQTWEADGVEYAYGFGGHEKIDEVSGSGNEVDMGDRWLDTRLGRTPKPDMNAVKYPAVSPYAYAVNNPINVVDRDGKDAIYIAFPSYKADGYPMTGHAGVLLIDNKTGLTKYYEYGRYDKPQLGVVNSYAVSNVIIGADGRPTAESLNKVLKQISDKSGKGKEIEGAYIESDKFKEMDAYAQKKLKENTDPNREPYSITGNNCGTFACDVIEQDKSLDTPTIIDPRPVSIVDEYQDEFTPVSYDSKNGTTIKYESGTVKSSDTPAPKVTPKKK